MYPFRNNIQIFSKANESGNLDKGGIRANDDQSQVTSNGQMMRQLNRSRWMFECPIACDTISDYELKSLNIMAASPALGHGKST